MSYFTASQESQINSAFLQLHNEFATRKPFYAVKESGRVIVTENPNHNAFYGAAPLNSDITIIKSSGMFFARAYYLNKDDNFHELNFANNTVETNVKTAANYIKVVTDITGKDLLNGTEDIIWNGNWFHLESTPSSHGLLQSNFYTFFLEEVK